MNPARLTLTDNGFDLAVAVRRMPSRVRHTHAGLCYREGNRLWFLHFAEDRCLEHEEYDGSYACAVPRIPTFRLPYLSHL